MWTRTKVDEITPNGSAAIDSVTGNHQGARTDLVDIIHEVDHRPDGNTKQRALRMLRNHRPDLHARVLAGELTPHKAVVEAGLLRRGSVTLGRQRRILLRLRSPRR
jgi:hypothetical protein